MTTIAKRAAVLTATVLLMSGVAVSSASASVGQHRIIPGQAANAQHPQHAERNAPDLYCDKQEAKCQ